MTTKTKGQQALHDALQSLQDHYCKEPKRKTREEAQREYDESMNRIAKNFTFIILK